MLVKSALLNLEVQQFSFLSSFLSASVGLSFLQAFALSYILLMFFLNPHVPVVFRVLDVFLSPVMISWFSV